MGFVGIADHPGDAREGGELFRSTLRITTRHDDTSRRIPRMKFADGIASLGIRRGGHRTRVYHHDVRIRGFIGRPEAVLAQLAFDSGAIGLRGPAAELFDAECVHGDILIA